jgi:virginiamycin B lyase
MQQRVRRSIAALALAVTACLVATAPAAVAAPNLREFRLPAQFALPNDVAAGPDGAVWATDGSLRRVWRITPKGKISSFEFDFTSQPAGITSAQGFLWIADAGRDEIVRIATDGTRASYPVPTSGAFPIDLVEGPDGAIWFTEGRGDKIGRLAPDGAITEYPLATRNAFAADIAVGPDGAIWFTEQLGDKVGRVTTSGDLTEFPLPPGTLPGPIAAGPDGALWFTARNTNAIMRMTTTGAITDTFPLPSSDADPVGLVAGRDGALWIAEHSADKIERMTLDGDVTHTFRLRRGFPDGLAIGPDRRLWFPEGIPGRIGRLGVIVG